MSTPASPDSTCRRPWSDDEPAPRGRRVRQRGTAALRTGMGRRGIVPILVALLATGGCFAPAPHPPRPAPPLLPCATRECLRVLTWNVHAIPFLAPWPTARLHNVAAKVLEQQPDLVLLQEVWSHAYARQLARDLAGAYRVMTATGCARPFPCGGLVVLVRNASGWTAATPRFAAYRASGPWYRLREWDAIAKKGILMVDLTRGGASLAVVDTHLQTDYARFGRTYSRVRRRQLEQLAETLDAAFPGRPILVGGDFNTAPREASGLYESHVATLGTDRTADLRAACAPCGTRPTLLHPARWLDYVLTRDVPATAAAARIGNDGIDQPFSDHDGVLVRLDGVPSLPPASR